MKTDAERELGCPGKENCLDREVDQNACESCQRKFQQSINPVAESFIEYAEYLYHMLERLELRLPVTFHGQDARFLVLVKRVREQVQREVEEKKYKMKERKN